MPSFNESQKAAIYAENHSILASAGAGAGKTSVMTERVGQQLLYHGKKIEQMLVVTFTNEAAFSMREKIRSHLRGKTEDRETPDDVKEAAREALSRMSACHISTLHSFCKYVLQTGYMLVGIDPQFEIADDVISRAYFDQAVKQAIENIASKSYPKEDKRLFGYLKRAATVDEMTETCRDLHNELMGVPNPYDRLHKMIDAIDLPENENPWVQAILSYNRICLESILSCIPELETLMDDPCFPEKNLPAPQADLELLKTLEEKMQDDLSISELIDNIRLALEGSPSLTKYSTRGLSAEETEVYEVYKTLRKRYAGRSSDLQKIMSDLQSVLDPQGIKDNQHIKLQLLGLEVLIREVGRCFTAIKVENNQLDFSDLEQYAYQILTNEEQPDVRDAIRSQFTDIFVDECQDVSGIQYAIITALQTPQTSTFFVGDIKQSIYRFRHADPLLFVHMRDTFSLDSEAEERKIFFRHNYRSSASIIDSINAVFASCMARHLTEIEYEEGDHLLVGREDIPCANTEVIVIRDKLPKDEELGPDETADKIEAECVELASRIQELVKEGYQYKDMVILLRVRTGGPEIADWLTKLHIPAYYDGKQSFFNMTEIAMFLEILKCIDNDHQDVPLITTLKNAPFFFTDEDLATIRAEYGKPRAPFYTCFYECAKVDTSDLEKRCHDANETICEWRTKAQITKTSDLIWMLLKEHGIYAVQGAMPGGEMRCKNLYALHQRAVVLESTGRYRLSEFLGYVRELTTLGKGGADVATPLGENDNYVRLMTIHASKGLEFPVVFILQMQRDFTRKKQETSKIQKDIETSNGRTPLGLYMNYTVKGRHISRSTFGANAFEYKRKLNALAEETRMLYVAMTRAQERLIMVGFGSPANVAQWNLTNKTTRILKSKTMFDMVMPVALGGEPLPDFDEERVTSLWRVRYVRPLAANLSDEEDEAARSLPEGMESDIDYHAEWHRNADNLLLPAKTAVTSVVSGHLELLGEEDDTPETQDDTKLKSFQLPRQPELPLFLRPVEAKTAANLGTLFHHFMELLDFEAFQGLPDDEYADELEKQITVLRAKDVFTTDEANEVRAGLDGVIAFLHTDIAQKFISGSICFFRERDLTVEIVSHGQKILVQGVIDIMYITDEGHWVILDYKTDHDARREVLIEKHKAQLNWYRLAVEAITEIPVDSMCLVSLKTGQCHPVPLETPKGFNIL